jgi:nitrite reductase/ring-hydroxylating ferredoxin subunit
MRRAGVIFLLCIGLWSCQKDQQGYVQDVPVNFRSPLSNPQLSALGSAGGVAIINGYGVSGLIIYRLPGGGYVAYDRCSSYQPEKRCAVNLDDTGFTVIDPCSGSKFSLADGTPVKAPASRSLKSYVVNVSNFEIFVSN